MSAETRSACACSEARSPATSFHIIAVRPMPMSATAFMAGAPSQRPVTITGASNSVIASCVAGT